MIICFINKRGKYFLFNNQEMQTGLQAAITAFEGMHRKLLGGIHKEKYQNYCKNRRSVPLIEAAKYVLNNKMIGLYGYVSYTPQKDAFYIRYYDLRTSIEGLEIPPSKELLNELTNKKITEDELIYELVKIYYEYALISFHTVYLIA